MMSLHHRHFRARPTAELDAGIQHQDENRHRHCARAGADVQHKAFVAIIADDATQRAQHQQRRQGQNRPCFAPRRIKRFFRLAPDEQEQQQIQQKMRPVVDRPEQPRRLICNRQKLNRVMAVITQKELQHRIQCADDFLDGNGAAPRFQQTLHRVGEAEHHHRQGEQIEQQARYDTRGHVLPICTNPRCKRPNQRAEQEAERHAEGEMPLAVQRNAEQQRHRQKLHQIAADDGKLHIILPQIGRQKRRHGGFLPKTRKIR